MIEFSIIEIVLFCWAVLATAYVFKYKEETQRLAFVLKVLLVDDEKRDQVVQDFKRFQKAE